MFDKRSGGYTSIVIAYLMHLSERRRMASQFLMEFKIAVQAIPESILTIEYMLAKTGTEVERYVKSVQGQEGIQTEDWLSWVVGE